MSMGASMEETPLRSGMWSGTPSEVTLLHDETRSVSASGSVLALRRSRGRYDVDSLVWRLVALEAASLR